MNHYYIYFYGAINAYCLFYVDRSKNEYAIVKVFSSKFSAIIYSKTHGLTVNN